MPLQDRVIPSNEERDELPAPGMADRRHPPASTQPQSRILSVLVTAVVFISFAAFATWRTPVPGVNEPCQLGKARHLWDPDWCSRDLFLQSANPHFLFYATFGMLTNLFNLNQTAWIGRILGWLILASGWTRFVSKMIPHRWAPVWAAWAFLSLQALGSFSGEWVIGGIEGKVVSYGCLLWSLSFIFDAAWVSAAWCAGLAVGFHPVVGGWSTLAGCFAFFCQTFVRSADSHADRAQPVAEQRRPGISLSQGLLATIGFVGAALPGLIPSVLMLEQASGVASQQANRVTVTLRLAHHLDPTMFPIEAYIQYTLLILIWPVLRRFARLQKCELFFAWYVVGSIGIGLMGLMIGWGPRIMGLMKFYPFRLADILIPLAVSVAVAGGAARFLYQKEESHRPSNVRGAARVTLLFAILLVNAFLLPRTENNPSRMSPEVLSDWFEVCAWVKSHTPRNALCWTGAASWKESSWAFKWYADRAEFLNLKDFPQDADTIVEWERRRRDFGQLDLSSESRRRFRKETGVDYVVTEVDFTRDGLTPIFRNQSFLVYDLSTDSTAK